MKMGLELLDKLEQFMDSVNINGFTFHDLEQEKTYEWKARCGPQPLSEIEEVIAYRGQDIITYYFVKDKYGMDEYRKIVGIGKKTDVIVMTNKDLSKGDYNFTIPYASDWMDLVS